MVRKKTSLPKDKNVIDSKPKLAEKIEKILSGEIRYRKRSATIYSKLDIIKDELLMLKGKNIPYTEINRLISDTTGVEISVHSLRTYCQDVLGFPKRRKGKAPDMNSVEEAKPKPSKKSKSSVKKK